MRREDKYPSTDTFTLYNANPKGRYTGDCVFRAIAKATGKSWEEVLQDLVQIAIETGYSPVNKEDYSKLLNKYGFEKQKQPQWPDGTKYTAAEFCKELDCNCVVVAHVGAHHLVAIAASDGKMKVHDTWDCTSRTVGNYWIRKAYAK